MAYDVQEETNMPVPGDICGRFPQNFVTDL